MKTLFSIILCFIVFWAVWTMTGLVWGMPLLGLVVGAGVAIALYVFLLRPGAKGLTLR